MLLSPLAAKVIRAVERAHWRSVEVALAGIAVKETEARMKRPTKADIIETREDVTQYLLENGGEIGGEFADGIRQALGWVLGVRVRPEYRGGDGSSPLSAPRG